MESSGWVSLVSSFGSFSAALIVAYYALQYVKGRDADASKLVDRMDAISRRFEDKLEDVAAKFDSTVKEVHQESRGTISNLFTLQKETISTMEGMKSQLMSLEQRISTIVPRLTEEQKAEGGIIKGAK